MSDAAISVSGVSKMYRMFRSRRHEVMSLLGFPVSERTYDAFWALRDINLDVPAGGKVGIIGHNGAGKSTLLKIIAGQVTPTEGKVRVRGKVQALMELGTGFHPEFNGRENVFAALGYQGITGQSANSRYEEILDFSELEDFIDNPIKTYSAGMYARLAFSVATAIEPEILIIDEVLGAGDAYFAAKCVDRMKQLTDGGATVLFVSHDMASVQRLCDQAIWINKGRIVATGETLDVSKQYMNDVRKREEKRIRATNMRLRRGDMAATPTADDKLRIIVHFIEDAWREPIGSLPISRVELLSNTEVLAAIQVGDAADNDPSASNHVITQKGYIDWSEPAWIAGRLCRCFTNTGGEYRHAALQFSLDPAFLGNLKDPVSLCVQFLDGESPLVQVEVFIDTEYVRIGTLSPGGTGAWISNSWQLPRQPIGPYAPETEASRSIDSDSMADHKGTEIDIIGDGKVRIERIVFNDSTGSERYLFEVGEEIEIDLEYRINELLPDLIVALAIYTADGITVFQDIFHPNQTDFIPGSYRLNWIFAPSPFGARDYVVSVALYRDFDELRGPQERSSYCLWDRRTRFRVERPHGSSIDMGILVSEPKRVLTARRA